MALCALSCGDSDEPGEQAPSGQIVAPDQSASIEQMGLGCSLIGLIKGRNGVRGFKGPQIIKNVDK